MTIQSLLFEINFFWSVQDSDEEPHDDLKEEKVPFFLPPSHIACPYNCWGRCRKAVNLFSAEIICAPIFPMSMLAIKANAPRRPSGRPMAAAVATRPHASSAVLICNYRYCPLQFAIGSRHDKLPTSHTVTQDRVVLGQKPVATNAHSVQLRNSLPIMPERGKLLAIQCYS